MEIVQNSLLSEFIFFYASLVKPSIQNNKLKSLKVAKLKMKDEAVGGF